MSDDSNRVSRRTALKGMAAFAGTSAVGAGTIIHASRPAAAVGHQVEIDDITIELSAEEGEPVGLSEIGLSDIWFDVEWENINTSVWVAMSFVNDAANTLQTSLGAVNLGVDGSGSETYGYGDTYEGSYDVDLDGPSYFDGETPLHVDANNTNGQAFLDELSLGGSESEKTVEIRYSLGLRLAREDGSIDYGTLLENVDSYFDVTVKRVSPDAEVGEGGEADAYGDS